MDLKAKYLLFAAINLSFLLVYRQLCALFVAINILPIGGRIM